MKAHNEASFKDLVHAVAMAPEKQGLLTMTLDNGVVVEVELRVLTFSDGKEFRRFNNPVGIYDES